MAKKIILFIIIVGIILGGFFYYFENPFASNEEEYINTSIYAVDHETKKQIKTGYEILVNNEIYNYGNTSSEYIRREKIPVGSNVTIRNKNIEEQEFYVNEKRFSIPEEASDYEKKQIKRIKFELREPGNIEITKTGLLHVTDNASAYIETDTILKDVVVCVDWSFHFFYAEITNLNKTDKIKEEDNCYFVTEKLEEEKETFYLDYKIFGVPNSDDYILLRFYDSRYKPEKENEDLSKPIKEYKYYY